MSTAESAARKIKELEPKDWRVLRSLEKALDVYESVPLSYVGDASGLHPDEVLFRLKRLNQWEFVVREGQGFVLLTQGLDALALKAFVNRSLVSALRGSLGMGKEADVFGAEDDAGRSYAVKFYRIGRISFRDVRRKRAFLPPQTHHAWLRVCIEAAKKEVNALSRLHPLGVYVPQPIARERHAILMNRLEGRLLADVPELPDAPETLRVILSNLRVAYVEGGFINGDLSQFNILFDGEKPWIIDWPQAVTAKFPDAASLLERDVSYLLLFFKRRFAVKCSLEDAVSYVRGWVSAVAVN